MRQHLTVLSAFVVLLLIAQIAYAADEPIKWSAPMQYYPNQWSPTAPPPPYFYYPNGYGYQGGSFGYGTYGGSWGYTGQYQVPSAYQRQNFSGNPYGSLLFVTDGLPRLERFLYGF